MSLMWFLYRKYFFFLLKECLLLENLLGKEIFISEINDIKFFLGKKLLFYFIIISNIFSVFFFDLLLCDVMNSCMKS